MPLIMPNDDHHNIKFPVFNLGFRIFFLLAGIYAIFSMLIWMIAFTYPEISFPFHTHLMSYQWHAHEMLYGYSLAVIAGFLLTAVKNWTGIATLHGICLMLLALFWLLARIAFFIGYMPIAAIFDILFSGYFILAISVPIIKAKQWMQFAIITKLILLLIAHLAFYASILGYFKAGVFLGTYAGLLLIIGLVMMISRRVVPFFIERGLDTPISINNFKIIDGSILLLFLFFFITELFQYAAFSAYLASILFILNAIRLIKWHTLALWKKPLLWSLYLALWSICLGFLLSASHYFFNTSQFLAYHAFAYGGIGLMTISMMSRVALGHTGREVHHPPKAMRSAFILLTIGAIIRFIIPLLTASYYSIWIVSSQILWIIAFSIFCYQYIPMLIQARVDGQFG